VSGLFAFQGRTSQRATFRRQRLVTTEPHSRGPLVAPWRCVVSLDFDRSKQRWRVRRREQGRQRSRRFKTHPEALAFERSLVTEAESPHAVRPERAGGDAVYPYSTDAGVRYV